jgi:hypothetical protein
MAVASVFQQVCVIFAHEIVMPEKLAQQPQCVIGFVA